MLSVRALSTSRECRLALLSSSLVSVKVSGRGDAVQTVVIWWGVDLARGGERVGGTWEGICVSRRGCNVF